jgi:hypothetical protein
MTKTFDEYMDDPRIINESMGLRITHAMRFKVQEERETMTETEYRDISNKRVERFFSEAGITPKYTSPYSENY